MVGFRHSIIVYDECAHLTVFSLSDLISCYLSPHFFGPDDDDKSHTYSLRQYVEIIKLAPAYQSCTLTLRFSLLECFQESVKIF